MNRVLLGRGLSGADDPFLRPGREHLHDAATLLGLAPALARLHHALAAGHHIRLVTDYDVDGTMSCLILHAALDRLISSRGSMAEVSYHIPDRMTEGYGLSERAVRMAAHDAVHLIVTADIGVRDHATVALARELGLDVIVVDHHLPDGASVPAAALAVICPPQQGCDYPNKALAACGVALKLAEALLADDPKREAVLASLWKLAAIGTVADVVDLSTAENRAIVSLGLRELNRGGHGAGLTALLQVAGKTPGNIDAQSLGFHIGPRINAAGRLADANAVIRLLRERDPAAALAQATALNRLNDERRDVQAQMLAWATEAVGADPAPFLVVGGEEAAGWHRGVNGIVAARLRDTYSRPAAVYAIVGPAVTGSIRSVPGVHAVQALDSVSALLQRYGGHPVAAGFSLAAEDLPAFRAGLERFAAQAGSDGVLDEVYDVDAEPAECTLTAVRALRALEPCGKGNPSVRVCVRGEVSAVRTAKDRHGFGRLGSLGLVAWDGAALLRSLEGRRAALIGSLEIDTDRSGFVSVRLLVEDAV